MFEKFNLLAYSLTNDDKGKYLTNYILTDITSRANLTAPEDAFGLYKVEEGERPEQVSNALYDTPKYHWVILMVNNFCDVYSDWFMSDETLYAYCQQKYDLSYTVAPAAINDISDTFTVVDHQLKPNDIVTISSSTMPGGLSQNTNYYVFNVVDDTFQLTTTLMGTSAIDITSVGSSNVVVYCNKPDQIVAFYDKEGNTLSSALNVWYGWDNDPNSTNSYRLNMSTIIADSPARYAYINSATRKSITETGTDELTITEQVTPIDEIAQNDLLGATNFEYEMALNRKRQYVKVLKPEYIQIFVDKFNAVIGS